MAQSTTAAASVSATQVDNRQARLDAAIALFRSEASASGYVVEEVRLRLPVPDVDVMPRVIIAQQSATASTPPTFPRSKHPRHLSYYPPPTSSDHPAVSRHEQPYSTSTKGSTFGVPTKPIATLGTKSGNTPGRSSGFKRTISGSVIFHPVPARAASSKREFNTSGTHVPQTPQKMGPLSSIPYMPSKESLSLVPEKAAPKDSNNASFWKTVIGSERGKAILRAAESMHRMRHGADGPKFRSPTFEEDTAEMEVESSAKLVSPSSDAEKLELPETTGESRQAREEVPENTLHINGHNIPESHVQLLLSSAADISAREKISSSKQGVNSPGTKTEKVEAKKVMAKPQETVNGKPSGTKANHMSYGKQYASKGRRDSSDRHHSRSFAARPFRCHKCPSSFDRDGHLRVHILAVHEKKRPFVCQVCDASFGHSSSLLRHVRTVHQASPAVGSGRCNLPSRSGQKSNDSGTTKSEDLCDAVEDDNEKHFRCSACGQTFHRVALLNRHVATRHPLQSSSIDKSDDT